MKKKKIKKLSWVPNLIKAFFIQKEKKHKITMPHECQIWYLVTRLYI